AVTPVASPSWKLSPSALLFAGWIAGAALFLLPMGVGLRQVRLLRRTGVPWPDGQSVAEGLTLDMGMRRRVEVRLHETLPGPMTCGVAHPTVVLPLDARNWNGEDLNRAIVHELEHVRRGDWVSHCLARAVCALYWFHPLVWMALRRLALEAERSCDDAVLARSEATAYADQLIGVARRVSSEGGMSAAKPPLLAMANRADLTTRVSALLDSGQRRGRVGAFPVALACAAAAVLVIALSPLRIVAAPQSATPNFLVRTMLARLYYDRGPENA
ncbi:MAG TPA: M56 family metallopeptidase, partial [Bryobacteraceae bacterium]|nr:M56 family metallopeptidase [Bryobacteraceae bacterium]